MVGLCFIRDQTSRTSEEVCLRIRWRRELRSTQRPTSMRLGKTERKKPATSTRPSMCESTRIRIGPCHGHHNLRSSYPHTSTRCCPLILSHWRPKRKPPRGLAPLALSSFFAAPLRLPLRQAQEYLPYVVKRSARQNLCTTIDGR